MNQEAYFEQRLNDQIAWFERKSGKNKRRYTTLKVLEIAMAVSIPFLSGLTGECEENPLRAEIIIMTLGAMGVMIALMEGIQTLYKYQDNWIKYRSAAEALNKEKYLFLTKSGTYRPEGEVSTVNMLVERVEGILAEENTNWVSRVRQSDENQGDSTEEGGEEAGDDDE